MFINLIANKRSGHTAIMYWLASQFKEAKYFGDEEGRNYEGRYYTYKENQYASIISHGGDSVNLHKTTKAKIAESDRLVILDNQAEETSSLTGLLQPRGIDCPPDTKYIIVLRDHFNNFASLLQMGENRRKIHQVRRLTDYWIAHAREIAGETKRLPNVMPILYNRWLTSKRYRQSICKQLGLTFTDTGFNRVPDVGGGSSFNAIEYDGKAAQMTTLKRYAGLENDSVYREFADNAEMLRLHAKLFKYFPLFYDHMNPWYYFLYRKIFGEQI